MDKLKVSFRPCACDTCKADQNAPQREQVGYELYYYCTANPGFVLVCEWFEYLSGEECKQLSKAVEQGLAKRGQLQYSWDRDAAWEALSVEERLKGYDAFIASYPKWGDK